MTTDAEVIESGATAVAGRNRPSMLKPLLALAMAAFIVMTALSYVFNWTWTGFSGNGTVWDWLSLFLLPIAVAAVPFAFEASTRAVAAVVVTVSLPLTVLLVGGYGFNWSWTGFQGNTLWDWLHLLLLPVAIPVAARTASDTHAARMKAAAPTDVRLEEGERPTAVLRNPPPERPSALR